MKRKIILSGIVGALLSGCLGEDVSPKSSGVDVSAEKKTSQLIVSKVLKDGEISDNYDGRFDLLPFSYRTPEGVLKKLKEDNYSSAVGERALSGRTQLLVIKDKVQGKLEKFETLRGLGNMDRVFAGILLQDEAALTISHKDSKVLSQFLVTKGTDGTKKVKLNINGGVGFSTTGGDVQNTDITLNNSIFTVSGNIGINNEGWNFDNLALRSNTLLTTDSDIVIQDNGYLDLGGYSSIKIQSSGNILIKSGNFHG